MMTQTITKQQKQQKINQLRSSILNEQQKIASKSRFGLFTQPPPLSLGDDSPYKDSKHPKGQNGKPITAPRNILPGPSRSGNTQKSYFQVPDSIHQGDIYKDTFKVQLQYQHKMHSKSSYHESQFKPTNYYKTIHKPSYQYIQQKQFKQKIRKLDENGRVKTQPRNIFTNTMTKVEKQFMKNPEYIPDPIERKKQQQKKQMEIFKSKLPQAAWKYAKNPKEKTFSKIKQVYGEDQQTKRLMQTKKQFKQPKFNTVQHQASFVPTKRPSTGPISKYPKAMSAQVLITDRQRALTTDKKQRQSWRPSQPSKSRPTPSISLLKKNLFSCRYK